MSKVSRFDERFLKLRESIFGQSDNDKIDFLSSLISWAANEIDTVQQTAEVVKLQQKHEESNGQH